MKTIKKALKKIVTSIFILVSILFLIIGANAMGFFKKEDKKEYREYKLSNYFAIRWLIPVQTSIALMLKQHPELESTVVKGIVTLPEMMDPRGEFYKLDAKTGPAVYFKSLQNIPHSFLSSIQVFTTGNVIKSVEGCEEYTINKVFHLRMKNGKGCIFLDAHEFILTQPIVLEAIRDALKHPKKYAIENNWQIWIEYVSRIIELSGGTATLDNLPYRKYKEDTRKTLHSFYQSAISTPEIKGISVDRHTSGTISLLYILRFLNNDGKVTHIEYFEPYITYGE